MLADPRRSRLVLINPARGEEGGVSSEFGARRRESLPLLPAVFEIFGVGLYVVGEYEAAQLPDALSSLIEPIDSDGLSLWRNERFTASLAASDAGVIFLGGAFLDEDVFITALEGVKLGYDMRLLADLSLARREADRSLVLDRLALHGVITTTVRQALLEWAACLDDPVLKQKVRQLLS